MSVETAWSWESLVAIAAAMAPAITTDANHTGVNAKRTSGTAWSGFASSGSATTAPSARNTSGT